MWGFPPLCHGVGKRADGVKWRRKARGPDPPGEGLNPVESRGDTEVAELRREERVTWPAGQGGKLELFFAIPSCPSSPWSRQDGAVAETGCSQSSQELKSSSKYFPARLALALTDQNGRQPHTARIDVVVPTDWPPAVIYMEGWHWL